MGTLVWLIPALPLAGFVVLVVFGRRMGEPVAGWLGTIAVASAFVVSVVAIVGLRQEPGHVSTLTLFTWIPAGTFTVDIGFLLDPLSATMVLVVTGVGALIHLYSIGYMRGDERFSQFFVYLNLFIFSMLMLVLGDNMLLTFLGWEGVGVCSYFLISFWFEKPANSSAAKKAFITNRIGDWGFMVGIFVTWFTFGTLRYSQVLPLSQGVATTTATVISVMLFIGAVGKSAQLPLYVWLPDAMAGPTPVSALIHAATMVTAGVYLMVRINPLLHAASPWVSTTIAWVGVGTALFAATIAIAQDDIKRVLAYSTVSQLGYMFLAIGVGGYWVAVFHMITHAFFKALLFLGAGSVIHGLDGEQDLRRMGALRKLMPITAGTFIVAWLAIAGVPPLSGFWSKDEVLTYALNRSLALYLVGLITALLTAFYMSREVFLVFYGKPRWDRPPDAGSDAGSVSASTDAGSPETIAGHAVHPHEAPWVMTAPLVVLAVLAAVAGFVSIPFGWAPHWLQSWLSPVAGPYGAEVVHSTGVLLGLLGLSTVVALSGIALAYFVYSRPRLPVRWFEYPVLAKGWYYDWAVTRFMGGPGRVAFDAIAWFDRTIIDGAVDGVGAAARGAGGRLRQAQTGYVRTYALGIAIGAVVLMMFVLARTTL